MNVATLPVVTTEKMKVCLSNLPQIARLLFKSNRRFKNKEGNIATGATSHRIMTQPVSPPQVCMHAHLPLMLMCVCCWGGRGEFSSCMSCKMSLLIYMQAMNGKHRAKEKKKEDEGWKGAFIWSIQCQGKTKNLKGKKRKIINIS